MSSADIVNSTIINMKWFTVDGKQVLRQLRRFENGENKWEDVGEEEKTETPFTERFLNDEHKPHSIEARNTENISKQLKKITATDFSDEAVNKARSMRLHAMLIRVCGGDSGHVRENGIYFNGNEMGHDLVRLMMEAYGMPWSGLTDKLHLGRRAIK